MKKYVHFKLFTLFVVILLCSVSAVAQVTKLPYFCGFEDPRDTVGWRFSHRQGATGFEVGGAMHCCGAKSMYISPDSGVTATYGTTSTGYVSMAYSQLTLEEGTYVLAFDYMMGGDGTNQDMKVVWAPASTVLNSSSIGLYSSVIESNQFADTTGANTFGKSAWRHVTGTVEVPAGGGTYNLCFAFRSNSETTMAPGACVDNIELDTVKGVTDCTRVPTEIQVTKEAQVGVVVAWTGNAAEYEVTVSSTTGNSQRRHTGVATTRDTIRYAELGEGRYFVYIRAICDSDTSISGVAENVMVYDAGAHCIDYVNLTAAGTRCTYGTYSNPYQNTGRVDNGPSAISSRHTVHSDPYEKDARTNGGLNTVPTGEVMSVRLGNWNDGSEGESITYTYYVPDESNIILTMKYAIVFEEPEHEEAPEFLLEIMNSNYVLLDHICTKANFLCDGTLTQGWHSCESGGAEVWWKEWTTIGVNLMSYAGDSIMIRLTTKDCDWSCHFGYAYFALGCQNAEITGVSCGAEGVTEAKAPDGFNYQWIENCTGQVVSTAQTLPIDGTDTCSYTCICSFKEQPTCTFALTAYTIPRLPESAFAYTTTYSDCETQISFRNMSQVYLLRNGVKYYLPDERITAQRWRVTSRHEERTYHNRTSDGKNFQPLVVPGAGDTVEVTLTTWYDGCDDDTTVTLYLPRQSDTSAVVDYVVISEGEACNWRGKSYTEPGDYYETIASTTEGCDTVVRLHLTVVDDTEAESVAEAMVRLVPNPVRRGERALVYGSFGEVASVELLDSRGQVVRSIEAESYPIEVGGVESAGVYFVRLRTTEGGCYVVKMSVW